MAETLQLAQAWDLLLHTAMLSLLAVGGAMAIAPDLQRLVVAERGWLSESQFTESVALAQAAPGPNILFIAVVGWNAAGVAGALLALVGILTPATLLTVWASRHAQRHRHSLGMRAFAAGMAPLTLGLMLATGWVLTDPTRDSVAAMGFLVAAVWLLWRTSIHPLMLLAAGALAGGLGWL